MKPQRRTLPTTGTCSRRGDPTRRRHGNRKNGLTRRTGIRVSFPNEAPGRRLVYHMLCLCFVFIRKHCLLRFFEMTVVTISDSHLKTKMTPNSPPLRLPFWRHRFPYRPEESITQREHIPMSPPCLKPVPHPISFHNNDSYESSTFNRANKQHVVVFMAGLTHQNTLLHILGIEIDFF